MRSSSSSRARSWETRARFLSCSVAFSALTPSMLPSWSASAATVFSKSVAFAFLRSLPQRTTPTAVINTAKRRATRPGDRVVAPAILSHVRRGRNAGSAGVLQVLSYCDCKSCRTELVTERWK